jgi:hypothetical protein
MSGPVSGRFRLPVNLLAATVAALLLSACIGANSRAEFEAIVQERGGGVSAAALEIMFDDLRVRTGADDPAIRLGRVNFGSNTAVFEVRNPARPDELDTYTYRNEQLVDISPVRLTSGDDLDIQTTTLSALSLDVESLTDRALAEFDSTGGYATGLSIIGLLQPVTIQVDVESPRASGTAVFDAAGELVEFRR